MNKQNFSTFKKHISRNFIGVPLFVWTSIVLIAFLKLFFVSGQHLFALGYAGHDDRLFVNMTDNILELHWLGHYNNLTLAKGIGYPVWIAITYLSGIPLLLSQFVLYIVSCLFLIYAFKPLIKKNYYLLLILFLVLVFNPASFSNDSNVRVLREGIYSSLSLFVCAFSIGTLVRLNESVKSLLVWVFGLGISLSWFWITREEGVWILAFIVPIALFMIFKLWKNKEGNWRLKIGLLGLPFIILYSSLLLVSSLNYFVYGVFSTVEFKNPYFLEAYGSLTRVKDQKWQRFLPVSREKMKQIYAVSPAFSELKPFLDGDLGKAWAGTSSAQLKFDNPLEIAGGWYMWAFRDSVAAAGYYKDGKTAMNYYKRLTNEIDTACKSKKLDCFPKRNTMVSPFYKEQISPIINSFFSASKLLVSLDAMTTTRVSASIGDSASLEWFSKITHEPVFTESKDITVQGWIFSPNEKLNLAIVSQENKILDYNLTFFDSPDVYSVFSKQGKVFENAKKSRFRISTTCKNECFLLITDLDGLSKKVPLDSVENYKNSFTSVDNIFTYIEYLNNNSQTQLTRNLDKLDDLKLNILNQIQRVYKLLLLPLTLISFLVFIFISIQIKKYYNVFYLINIFVLFAIILRLIILSVIDATLFYSLNVAYLSPLYPLLLLFITLNLISLKYILKNDPLPR